MQLRFDSLYCCEDLEFLISHYIFQLSTSLRSHSVKRPGYFNDIEMAEAIETLTPLYSESLRQRLFNSALKSSQKQNGGGFLKVDTTARIFSFLFQLSKGVYFSFFQS